MASLAPSSSGAGAGVGEEQQEPPPPCEGPQDRVPPEEPDDADDKDFPNRGLTDLRNFLASLTTGDGKSAYGVTENELQVVKVLKLIESLQPCNVEELGSVLWRKKANALFMVWTEITVKSEGPRDLHRRYVDQLIKHGKLPLLIHDAVLIWTWLEEILPQFRLTIENRGKKVTEVFADFHRFEPQLFGGTMADIMDYHRSCLNILAMLTPLPDVVQSLGEADDGNVVVDFIELAIAILKDFTKDPASPQVTGTTPKFPKGGKRLVAYHALTCLVHFIWRLDMLPEKVAVKIKHPENGLIGTLVDLLVAKPYPWVLAKEAEMEEEKKPSVQDFAAPTNVKELEEYEEAHIRRYLTPPKIGIYEYDDKEGGMDKLELAAWSILRKIFMTGEIGECVELAMEWREKLMLLQDRFNSEEFVKTAPAEAGIVQLQNIVKIVSRTSLDQEPRSAAPVGPYHASIRADLRARPDAIIKIHLEADTFECVGAEDTIRRLGGSQACHALDLYQICFCCLSSDARLRCSGCNFAYYCNRECQRKEWKQHKKICAPIKADIGEYVNMGLELPPYPRFNVKKKN